MDAFLAVSRNGDFDALLPLLDADVVLRADEAAVKAGASPEVHGAPAVAEASRDEPGSHNRRLPTELLEPCELRAGNGAPYSASRSCSEGSSQSNYSPSLSSYQARPGDPQRLRGHSQKGLWSGRRDSNPRQPARKQRCPGLVSNRETAKSNLRQHAGRFVPETTESRTLSLFGSQRRVPVPPLSCRQI